MVETGGLENRFALTGNGGSNPSPSAINSSKRVQDNPKKIRKPQRQLGFSFFNVRRRIMEAGSCWGYFWGYLLAGLGVVSNFLSLEALWRSLTP